MITREQYEKLLDLEKLREELGVLRYFLDGNRDSPAKVQLQIERCDTEKAIGIFSTENAIVNESFNKLFPELVETMTASVRDAIEGKIKEVEEEIAQYIK